MNILLAIFGLSLVFGQTIAINLGNSVRIFPHEIILAVIYLLWFSKKPKINKLNLVKSIIGFTLIGVISLLVQIPQIGLNQTLISSLYLVRWVYYAGLYFVIATTGLSVLPILYLSGIGVAVLGILQLWLYPDLRNLYYLGWDPHYRRLFSTLLDPNFTGIYLVLAFILGIYLSLTKAKNKILMIFGEAVILISVLLTYSRSAYLALVSALISLMLVKKLKILLVILLALIGIVIIFPKPAGDTYGLIRQETSLARINNWSLSLQYFIKKPILGYGFDTLRHLPIANPEINGIPSTARAGVDNSFLFILLTTGIFGLIIYLWMLGLIFQKGLLIINKNLPLGILVICTLSAVIINSQFINSLFYPFTMIWIFIIAGFAERGRAK